MGATTTEGEDEARRRELSWRIEQTFGKAPIPETVRRVRQIVGPTGALVAKADDTARLAEEARVLLLSGRADWTPSPIQLKALEQMIRLMRPAVLSKRGLLADLPVDVPAFAEWRAFTRNASRFVPSVGRIYEAGAPREGAAGTCFLVAPHLVVTNVHVLDDLSANVRALERGQAEVDFGLEFGVALDQDPVDVLGVLVCHPELDLALLEVAPQNGRPVLTPSPRPCAIGAAVAVVGYPSEDVRSLLFADIVFNGHYRVKQGAPGLVTTMPTPQPKVFAHDCSTLGGSSGSPILSIPNADLVGVHFDGRFLGRNLGIEGAALAEFLQAPRRPRT